MIEVNEHEGNYLDVCRHYRAMAATPSWLMRRRNCIG